MKFFHWEIIKEGRFYNHKRYKNILEDPWSFLGRKINFLVSFCVFLWVAVIIFETLPGIGDIFWREIFLLEIGISLIFALEYLYRFLRSRNKWRFPIKIMSIVDLLSFLPFFLGLVFQMVSGFDFLKILRLLRILRLFHVTSHSPIVLGFIHTLHKYRHEYKAIFSVFITVLVIISTFVYYSEAWVNESFSSIPAALWWWVITMTTVWYGDMVPITLYGKLFWTVLILLGPVLLAVIWSITILVFMDVSEWYKTSQLKMCRRCRTLNRIEANFCDNCGEQDFVKYKAQWNDFQKSDMKKLFSKW